jgi:uncharacterized Zn-finger protein
VHFIILYYDTRNLGELAMDSNDNSQDRKNCININHNIVYTSEKSVSCYGTHKTFDHPLVYLDIGHSGSVRCPYCSKTFVLQSNYTEESSAVDRKMSGELAEHRLVGEQIPGLPRCARNDDNANAEVSKVYYNDKVE